MSVSSPLADPLPAARRDIAGRAGRIAFYAAGKGAPMLLVHSVNAAASAFEVRALFERMTASHRVFAIDLPGFGQSDRSDRPYDIALFRAAIDDALDAVATEVGDIPVDLLALSLSSEFAARVAVARPTRVRTLAMVTPTGLDRRSATRIGPAGGNREVPGVHAVVSFRPWSQLLFDALVSRRSVRYFLGRTWGSDRIDEDLFEYSWAAAHRPGARYAPLAFLSGRLFSSDIRTVYEQLVQPVWVPHGTRGDFRDFSGADWTRARPNWSLQPFESGALPHVEHPDAFATAYRRFLVG